MSPVMTTAAPPASAGPVRNATADGPAICADSHARAGTSGGWST